MASPVPLCAACVQRMAEAAADAKSAPAVPTSDGSSSAAGRVSSKNPLGIAEPDTSHFVYSSDFEDVYEPAEDSYLLMDAISSDAPFLRHRLQTRYCDFCAPPPPPQTTTAAAASAAPAVATATPTAGNSVSYACTPVCLEVGSGSGLVSSYVHRVVSGPTAATATAAASGGTSNVCVYATDINPRAAALTKRTFAQNAVHSAGGGGGDVVVTSLVSGLMPRMTHSVDVLIFNPPYVPSESDELLGDGVSRAWAGGVNGREVLDQLIPSLDRLLSARAVFYCVVLPDWNQPVELLQRLKSVAGLGSATILAERKAGREHLQIYRFTRDSADASAAAAAKHSSLPATATAAPPPAASAPMSAAAGSGDYFGHYSDLLHHLSGSHHSPNEYRGPTIADYYSDAPYPAAGSESPFGLGAAAARAGSGGSAAAPPSAAPYRYSSRALASAVGGGTSLDARDTVQEMAQLTAWNLELRRDVNALTAELADERTARLELTALVRSMQSTIQTLIEKTGVRINASAGFSFERNGNGNGAAAAAAPSISATLHPPAASASSTSGGSTSSGSASIAPLSPHRQQRTRTVFPSPVKSAAASAGAASTSSGATSAASKGHTTGSGSAGVDPALFQLTEYLSTPPRIRIKERAAYSKEPDADPRVKYAPPKRVPTRAGTDPKDDSDSELDLAVTTDEPVVRTLTGDLAAVCRRCGVRFNVNRTSKYDCAYHPGRLHRSTGRYDCCGVIGSLTVGEASDRPVFCRFGSHIS